MLARLLLSPRARRAFVGYCCYPTSRHAYMVVGWQRLCLFAATLLRRRHGTPSALRRRCPFISAQPRGRCHVARYKRPHDMARALHYATATSVAIMSPQAGLLNEEATYAAVRARHGAVHIHATRGREASRAPTRYAYAAMIRHAERA